MALKQISKTKNGSEKTSSKNQTSRSMRSSSRIPDPALPTPARSESVQDETTIPKKTRATGKKRTIEDSQSGDDYVQDPSTIQAKTSNSNKKRKVVGSQTESTVRKRQATEDIPIASIEAPPPAKKRRRGSSSSSGSDPLWGSDAKHISFVSAEIRPASAAADDAKLASAREAKWKSIHDFQRNIVRGSKKPKPTPAFWEAQARKRKDIDRIPTSLAAPSGARWEYTTDPGVTGDTGAIDSANILAGSRRARKATAGSVEAPKRRRAAQSATSDPTQPPAQSRRRRRLDPPVVAQEEKGEEDEEGVEIPTILSREPSPYPGEERESGGWDGEEDEDGLGAPSRLHTIVYKGKEYREFRRDAPDGGEEERYWIRVRR